MYLALYPSVSKKWKTFLERPLLRRGATGFASYVFDMDVADGLHFLFMIVLLIGVYALWWAWKWYELNLYPADVGNYVYSASGASGHWCDWLMGLTLIPVSRSSFIVQQLGVSTDSALKYHKLCAYGLVLGTIVHGYITFGYWITVQQNNGPATVAYQVFNIGMPAEYISWSYSSYTAILGVVASFVLFIMVLAACPVFRRGAYSFFALTHPYFAVILLVFAGLHADSDFYCFLPGLFLYGIELLERFLQYFRKPSEAVITVEENQYLRIDVDVGSTWECVPSQWTLLQFPTLSIISHPVAKLSDGKASFLVKPQKGVTRKLLSVSETTLPVRVCSPKEPISFNVDNIRTCICLVAGSGVTGAIALVNAWISTKHPKTGRIFLAWVSGFDNAAEKLSLMKEIVDAADSRVSLIVYSNRQAVPVVYDPGHGIVGNLGTGFKAQTILERIATAEFKEVDEDSASVGVFICGPKSFTVDVRRDVEDQKKSGFDADVHIESYEW
ncbi:hypothetical protein HDU82_008308 [Entophlyctis luteolus]|nr:hypothetical protein HDU82_008308 [Entophlyctis luteolus]